KDAPARVTGKRAEPWTFSDAAGPDSEGPLDPLGPCENLHASAIHSPSTGADAAVKTCVGVRHAGLFSSRLASSQSLSISARVASLGERPCSRSRSSMWWKRDSNLRT